jgi:Secretion system C-terminal sorting domain/PKD-like domain
MKTNYKLILLLLLVCCFTQSNYAQKVIGAEYFWDTDPGKGLATPMAASDGNFNSIIEQVFANTAALPAVGVHTLNMRMRDQANKWSRTFSTVVDINPASVTQRAIKVTLAEYFWDTDPGQGNATALIAFDGAFDAALETAVKSGITLPAVGIHTMNIRVRDAENHWGPVFTQLVDITPNLLSTRLIKITAGECFWDSDPGQGNGTTLLAYDGAFDEAVESVTKSGIALPTTGVHKFNLRVKDAQNKWSSVFSTIVEITPNLLTVRPIRVLAAEYFFDTDPGAGNATPMLALDGNFNSAIESIKGGNIPSPVLSGKHVLYLRVKGASGAWGNKFGIVVNMDIDIDNFITNITGATALCYSTVFNNNYISVAHSGNTYTWTITGGTITSGLGTNSVNVNWTFTGIHKLKLVECNAAGTICATDSIFVSVSPPTNQTVNRFICNGDSIFLQNAWRKTSGLYLDSLLSIGGCDSIVNTNLALYPSYNLTAATGFCTGQSVIVGGVSISTAGVYTQNFTSVNGCDSIRVTTVSEYLVSIVNTNANVCVGDSIFLQGAYQQNPGTYTDVLISSKGCDSVVVTQLFVRQPSSSSQTNYICQGDSILLGGSYQTSANVYVDVLTNAYGCDSTRTTTLIVWPSYADTVAQVIFQGDSIFLAGAYQFTSGYYSDTLSTLNGCDSIKVTDLSVIMGVNTIGFASEPKVFPNPFQENVRLLLSGNLNATISIFDMTGRILYRKENANEKQLDITTGAWTSGVYFIQVLKGDKQWMSKLLKAN